VRTLLLALVCLLALPSCAAQPDSFAGALDFTVKERAAIASGNAWVAAHTGTPPVAIRWEKPDVGERRILRVDQPAGTLGSSSPTCIALDPFQGGDRLAAVAAHEFAHVLGIAHHAGRGLMNPTVPAALEWTVDDQQACEDAGVCIR
jgi:hypothetical protein